MYPPPAGPGPGPNPMMDPHYRVPPPPPPPPTVSAVAALSFAWGALKANTSTWVAAAVFGLIPVVGPIAVQGWHAEVMQRLERRQRDAAPPLEFGQLTTLLSRGLPAFLVALIMGGIAAVLVTIPLTCVAGVGSAFALSARQGSDDGAPIAALLVVLLGGLLFFALMLPLGMMISAATLRAELTEDFSASLQPGALWDFVKRTWTTQLTAGIAFAFLSMGLVFLGMLLCFVGVYAVVPILQLAAVHFRWQLYQLYLHRGGTPIPVKPPEPTAPHAGGPMGYPTY